MGALTIFFQRWAMRRSEEWKFASGIQGQLSVRGETPEADDIFSK